MLDHQKQDCEGESTKVDGVDRPVTMTVEVLLLTYNTTCLRDEHSGQYCAAQLEAWADWTSLGKLTGSPELPANASCSNCILGGLELDMRANSMMGTGDVQNPHAPLEALASSCGFSGLASTASSLVFDVPTARSSSGTTVQEHSRRSTDSSRRCARRYTVQPGDNCHSVCRRQNSSTVALMYLNNLPAHCSGDFPSPGQSLCLPHACQTYTVQPGDSCGSIVRDHGHSFTVSQLVSWNPDIHRSCANIGALVNDQICVRSVSTSLLMRSSI